MTIQLPPTFNGDVAQWARQLTAYLIREQQKTSGTTPVTLLLEHKIGDAKATTDGTLMFDPALGKVVVAIGGAWVAVH